MNAQTNQVAAGPAWIEMPQEFIEEFFRADAVQSGAEPVNRKPGLGLLIGLVTGVAFWVPVAAAAF